MFRGTFYPFAETDLPRILPFLLLPSADLWYTYKNHFTIIHATERCETISTQNSKLRIRDEKKAIRVSSTLGVIVAIAEVLMYLATHSQAILIDGIYDSMDVVILVIYQLLIPLLYKPVSEKIPYGFAQVESLFILIKGSILILVTLLVIYDNIQVILHGGSHLDTGLILYFEFALTMFCVAGWLLMRYLGQRLKTPMIKVEVITWKIDVFLSLGAFLGFGLEIPFHYFHLLEWTIPYIDSVISCIIAALMLPEPTRAFINAIRELVLMAPPAEKIEEIRTITAEGLKDYPYDVDFIDAVRTGRRLWISLYVTTKGNIMNIKQLKEATDKLRAMLSARYTGVYLELIPDVAPDSPAVISREDQGPLSDLR
ncbi:cation diffusion facilitator family transporter [Eubacterium sp. F2]|uniref:cation diffusion facilitator family transporter n=1 Tax=Eubacterium sp. F2 TaxID=3381348 RepID=UPI0039083EA8